MRSYTLVGTLLFGLLMTTCLVVSAADDDDDKYPTTFDNVDVDEILSNDRLFTQYTNCLRNKGKCSPEGAALKKFLPDAIQTKCAKCTEKQKEGAEKVIKYVTENKPDVWKEISAIYDPKGEYAKKYEQDLKRIQTKP